MSVYDPTFKEWLNKFVDTDTNLADLAIEVKKDDTFPDTSDKNKLMAYIERRTPNTNVHNTLSAAIDLYNAASGADGTPLNREPYQL